MRVLVLCLECRFSLSFISLSVADPVFFCLSPTEDLIAWWLRQLSVSLQCRRPGLDPWVGKIPWRGKWQPTPVCLPGESHGWRSLVDYSPWSSRKSVTTERLHFQQRITDFLGLPGGPVVKTLYLHRRGRGFHPAHSRASKTNFHSRLSGVTSSTPLFFLSFFLLYHGFPFFLLNVAVH